MKMNQKLLLFILFLLQHTLLSAQFKLEWGNSIGSGAHGRCIAQGQFGEIYAGGKFSGQIDLDPGPGAFVAGPTGAWISNQFIEQWDPSGNLQWAHWNASGLNATLYSMTVDAFDDLVITGSMIDSLLFDNGLRFNGSGGFDTYVAKYNTLGKLVWAKRIGGLLDDEPATVITDPQGFIYVAGRFQGTCDFNPDPLQTYNLTSNNSGQAFLLKLDTRGNFVWVKTLEGMGNNNFNFTNRYTGMSLDHAGNLLLSGKFLYTVDLDPGPDTLSVFSGQTEVFIQKLDQNGNLIWAKTFDGATTGSNPAVIAAAPDNSVLLASDFFPTIDVDPGPGVTSFHTADLDDVIIVKLSEAGDLIWGRQIEGYGKQFVNGIASDGKGSVYVSGTFNDYTDFDPGSGIYQVPPVGTGIFKKDVYLVELDSAGILIEPATFGGTNDDYVYNMLVDEDSRVLLCGLSLGGLDLDPTPGQQLAPSGAYFASLSQTVLNHQGRVFRDLNQNLLQDPDEPGLFGKIVGAKHHLAYSSTDSLGNFHVYRNLTDDTLVLFGARPYWSVTPKFIPIDTLHNNFDFAVYIPPVRDACISAVNLTSFRSGFDTEIQIRLVNTGPLPLDSVPVVAIIASQLGVFPITIVSSDPTPVFQENNQIKWLTGHLDPDEEILIKLILHTSNIAPIGQNVILSVSALLPNDADPGNNGVRIIAPIRNSFDPNEKVVTPDKVEPEAADTTAYQYVIRFQNTGNASTSFIVIRDTLPLGLDISSLNVQSASHPYTWRLVNNRILEFSFDPIELPDSTSNEPESHGFVAFSIKSRHGLSLGDSIINRAGIYFDYNDPVMTRYSVLKVAHVSAVHEPVQQPDWLMLELLPNPVAAGASVQLVLHPPLAQGALVRIFDASGREVHHGRLAANEEALRLPVLPAGNYFVQVRTGARTGGKVLIVK